MSGIVFLVATVAAVYVVYWAYRNDQAGDHGRTTGLLAMREPTPAPRRPATASRSKFSRDAQETPDGSQT